MQDADYYRQRAADALREAGEETLPNARKKHLDAAEAWQAMGRRVDRVAAAADRNAAAKIDGGASHR